VDAYILAAVRRKIPRAIVHSDVLDLEIDEIAQRTRIKLWQAMQREHIANVRSYVNSIVYTETIDFIRKYKPVAPLPLDEDGELYHEHILATFTYSSPDPAEQFEQAEAYSRLTRKLAQAVKTLPPKQRQAIICALKDYSIDNRAFVEVLALFDLDIANTHWPKELREIQTLRASLSVARRKLCALKKAA
jgi:DNA-directed RNA polymerase specialized sigma24 family protein